MNVCLRIISNSPILLEYVSILIGHYNYTCRYVEHIEALYKLLIIDMERMIAINKYGIVAVKAVQLLREENIDPLTAWKTVATGVLGEGTWAQRKGCPKNAFLGLCEAGVVRGIFNSKYVDKSGSQKNKNYAVRAVQILRDNPELAEDKLGLWREVMNGGEMSHNSQMDVVLSLWNNNLIVSE